MPTKIILAGEGGQGVQTVAKIIADAAKNSGRESAYLPSFGVEQRGGVSLAFLQISSNPIPYPRFDRADIAVCFSNRAVATLKKYLTENTLFIYDNSAIETSYLEKVKDEVKHFLAIPSLSEGLKNFSPKVANVIMLGGIAAHLKEISYQEFEKAIIKNFGDKFTKKPELKDLNLGALKKGMELAEKFDQSKTSFSGIEAPQIKRVFSKEKITWTRFPEYCKGCGLCLVTCPQQAIKASKDLGFLGTQMPEVDIEKCIACQKCQQICPDGALRVDRN